MEWHAERAVDETAAAGLLAAQFPRLAAAPVTGLATGWDNTVFLVGGRWVFRFPRREAALPGVRREIALLPHLAPPLPLRVPVPEFVGEPTEAFPWPFWGSELVPGRELAEAGLADDARGPAAAAVGAFLAALHGTRRDAGGAGDLPVDPMRRSEPRVKVPATRERLERIAARGLWSPDPAVERALAAATELPAPTDDPVLSHGDLHLRHLLVGDDGTATGVIDWGDLCLADPAVDLSLAFSAFRGASRAALLGAYGRPLSAEREARARAVAVFLCAALADYAAADARPRLLAEAIRGLARAVDD